MAIISSTRMIMSRVARVATYTGTARKNPTFRHLVPFAAGATALAVTYTHATSCAGKGPYTLRYFPVPGAPGEIVRLLLLLSGEEWTDEITGAKSKPSWREVKGTTPFGQMPVLYCDGEQTQMSQSRAISRFLAAKVKLGTNPVLLSSDPFMAYQADALVDGLEDVRSKIVKTFAIKNQTEKEAARAALFSKGGDIYEGFKKINTLISKNGSTNGHMLGDTFTLADLWAFVVINQFRAGFLDGVPTNGWLDDMPRLKEVVDTVAGIPAVKVYYTSKAKTNKLYAPYVAK